MMIEDDLEFPTFSFEMASTLRLNILSRSQHRNHSRHNRHHLERQAKEIILVTPKDEDVPSPIVSPLLMEKLFHSLNGIDGKEDGHHIYA